MILGIVLEHKRQYTLIHMKGELLPGNIRILEEVLDDQMTKSNGTIALVMDGLDYIDPCAARKLAGYKKDAELRKKSLIILCDSPSRRKILNDSGLDRTMQFTTSSTIEEEQGGKRKFPFPGLNLQLNLKL